MGEFTRHMRQLLSLKEEWEKKLNATQFATIKRHSRRLIPIQISLQRELGLK